MQHGLDFTYLRDTLFHVERQNVTLSIPKDLLRQAKHLAVERGTSLSGLLADCLRRVVRENQGYRQAQRRLLERLEEGYDLGTRGRVGWSRDDLYHRSAPDRVRRGTTEPVPTSGDDP